MTPSDLFRVSPEERGLAEHPVRRRVTDPW